MSVNSILNPACIVPNQENVNTNLKESVTADSSIKNDLKDLQTENDSLKNELCQAKGELTILQMENAALLSTKLEGMPECDTW